MRNIEKQAEQGKAFFNQHPKADLTVKELRYMIDEFTTEGKENLTKPKGSDAILINFLKIMINCTDLP